MLSNSIYPFTAVVAQKQVKKALLIALVNPKAGGLLIGGRKGTAKTTLVRISEELIAPQKIINLPLNVTEDMLFGSIDIEYAVSKGERRFLAGILGRANGNVLYIDETNLLRQELLSAVLDANSAGFNHVERDGISFTHEVNCTVIGTMNPEEGVLPSHILDRFGMYVDVQGEQELSERVEIMRRSLAYSKNVADFRAEYVNETEVLREQLVNAKKLLTQIEVTEIMMQLAAQMCAQAFCAGHRAETFLLEVAKAIAALANRSYILPSDMQEAAVFVLPHRMRQLPEQQEQQEQQEEMADNEQEETSNEDDASENDNDNLTLPQLPETETAGDELEKDNNEDKPQNEKEQDKNQPAPEEEIADIDKAFRLPKIVLDLGKNLNLRRCSGKRSTTRTDLKQGRYVRAELSKNKVEDLAFDATIRAAAPYQKIRKPNACALNIQKEDLRQKVREKRIGNTFLFAVDASGSMGARSRMSAVKGAIFYMLQDAYQKRDRVGMLAFRRDKAELLLPITRSVDLAQKRLAELPTGGKTPLADALATALLTLAKLKKNDSELEPILVLVTDGRANAVENGEDPVAAAVKMAEKIRKAKITSVVIDTESDFIKLGVAKKMAQAMGASYYNLNKLSKEQILRIVRNLGD